MLLEQVRPLADLVEDALPEGLEVDPQPPVEHVRRLDGLALLVHLEEAVELAPKVPEFGLLVGQGFEDLVVLGLSHQGLLVVVEDAREAQEELEVLGPVVRPVPGVFLEFLRGQGEDAWVLGFFFIRWYL